MQKLQRPALILILVVGLGMAFWPVGEKVYGWWSQRALQVSWQRAAKAAAQQPGMPGADKQKTSAGKKKKSTKATEAKANKWQPTRIIIPDIKLDAVVVQGVDNTALRQGPGHDKTSALPGQKGNCVIAAHRNVYGWWFYKLNYLGPGMEIELKTPTETYQYQVEYSATVDEHDTTILQAPADENAAPRLILYTCTLPKSDYRELVIANLVSIKPSS